MRFCCLLSATNRRPNPGVLLRTALLVGVVFSAAPSVACALITGGKGNAPVNDPGWPEGAAAVFNVNARVAWWEGPPYGGGQWHAECRGDAAALNEVLQNFAKISAKTRRLIVSDGVGHSFWLDANNEDEEGAADIDWMFMVWVPGNWQQLRRLPVGLRPQGKDVDAPVPELHVYTGGNVKWSDVEVPDGIEVVDNRLEAHGFTLDDGTVLEGTVIDLETGEPVVAEMQLQFVKPLETGGYEYTTVEQAETDEVGRWVLKSAPEGWHRVVVAADGYVPRIVGYEVFRGQPEWHWYAASLARTATVTGRILDEQGQPLADARVLFRDVAATTGELYQSSSEYTVQTDDDGRFELARLPIGAARVTVYKDGYCFIGLGPEIELPSQDVQLTMKEAAQLQVVVDFENAERPGGYIVSISPAEGEKVGSWGGSGNVDASGAITFENVPPGTYVLTGRPNPGSAKQTTDPVTVTLEGGESREVVLIAK